MTQETEFKKTRRGRRGGGGQNKDIQDVYAAPNEDFPAKRQKMEYSNDAIINEYSIPELDNDTRTYFQEMEKMLENHEFESLEDKNLFINNIYNELDGKEILVAGDYDASRILEKLLHASNDFHLRVVMSRLSDKFTDLIKHQFASHVCQTLISLGADVAERELKGESLVILPDDSQEMKLPSMEDLIITQCRELSNSWVSLMTDNYASHILRTLLNVLSGASTQDTQSMNRSKRSKRYNSNHNIQASTDKGPRAVSETFTAAFEEIAKSLINTLNSKEIKTLALHPVANPVLQLLITFPQFSNDLINKMMGDDQSFIGFLIQDQVGSHLMEKILASIDSETFKNVYEMHFKDKLIEFSEHYVGNFVVQHLIINCKTKEIFKNILDELESSFEFLLFRNRPGVVTKLAEACIQFKEFQKPVLTAIKTAFRIDSPEKRKNFINMILHMRTSEQLLAQADYLKVQLQGSLLLQHLLSFHENENQIILEGIYALDIITLMKWINDPQTSRIIEKLFESQSISMKSKKKMLYVLSGKYVTLAKDKYASHLIDKCWKIADIKMKEIIATELCEHEKELVDNFYGKFVLRNCKIDLFKRRKDEWIGLEKGLEKKKELFKDFY